MPPFIETLSPMLTLFLCIAIGFTAGKTKILPINASQTIAKLETWIFCPALSFMTMLRYCTVETLFTHSLNIILAAICVAVAMAIAIPISKLLVKNNPSERGVYSYALAFANSSYFGDPVVLSLFGGEALAYYKLFTLPFIIMIYIWGIDVLTPKDKNNSSPLKRLLNAPTVAMLVGIICGLTGIGAYLPNFVASGLEALKSCMGPCAMLLAGVTVARYNLLQMLKKKKVYIATALRLIFIPAVIIAVLFAAKTLINVMFSLSIGNDVLFLCFFATAAPLGLNTVVFPEAYGGNSETGASMTIISHALGVISIPLMYALMTAIFGTPFA